MNRDATLGSQYVVLAAALGSAHLLGGGDLEFWLTFGVTGVAVWYLARAAVPVAAAFSGGLDSVASYHAFHSVGVSVATLGVLGVLQARHGLVPLSHATTLLMLGVTCAAAGILDGRREADVA